MASRERKARKPTRETRRPLRRPRPPTAHGPGLDRYDVAILGELQRDARLSNAELAVAHRPVGRADVAARQVARAAGLHHRLPRRARPPPHRPGRAGLRARRRRAQQRQRHARAGRRDPRAARGDRLPLHQRRRHLRAAGDGHRPRRLSRACRRDTLFNLPNVKDIHTSFSLGRGQGRRGAAAGAPASRSTMHAGKPAAMPRAGSSRPDAASKPFVMGATRSLRARLADALLGATRRSACARRWR